MKSTIQRRIEAIQRGETPNGYKKTKWGIIPVTWETAKIAQVGEITTGSTPSTSNKSYFGNRYLWVTPTDINCKYITSTNTKLSEEGIKKVRFLEKNSVLVTCIASIGKNAILTEAGACNQQINAITVNDNYNHEFIYYKMCEIAPVLERFAGKTATSIINKMQFSNLILALPPLPEQEAIAEILTQQDRIIDLKQRLIEEKRKQKKYLMQTLLTGKIRLPGFNGKWKNVRLGDVVILEYGKPLKESQRTDGIYPVLGSNGRIGSHNTFLVSGPCIIIGRKGSAGEIVWEEHNCYPIDTTFYVQTRITITLKYIYYLLLIQKMVDEKQNSSVPGLNRNDVYRIKVSLPPLPEQEAIAEILSTADEELSLLERELEQEKLRKKALMQLLLTGLVRVEEL